MPHGGPILITGATGKIATLAIPLLVAKGAKVRALVRNPEKVQQVRAMGAEVFTGDLSEPESLAPALNDTESLLMISTSAPEMPVLQSALADAAIHSGVGFIAKISGIGADSQSAINTGRWHGQIEEKIAGTGVDYCFLRPAGFMQNLLGMGQAAKNSGTFKTCRTDGREAMVDARDVAAVAAAVLTESGHSRRVYELTGPQAHTIDEIAAAISEISSNRLAPERISEDEYRAMMLGYGMAEWVTNDLIAWGRMIQEPSSDVRAVLGRDATTLQRFLEDHANAFRR